MAELRIERRPNARINRVFEFVAWPEHLVKWWQSHGRPLNRVVFGCCRDGGANPASGYSLVNADDMAKGCPMVVSGEGSVEVAECFDT